ncbi:MAG TPA: SDR family oxidoreductase [Aliidongia sp.]|nr:SDR family oxidoreductase [Aliidongia sp.]
MMSPTEQVDAGPSGRKFRRVLVTGGAGYVGSMLTGALLDAGYEVVVLDLYIYGPASLAYCRDNPRLKEIKGDLRDAGAVAAALAGVDAVIHLACISNDPSFDLDPHLGESINFTCFRPLVRAAKEAGARRFIYASSSSVYGVKDEEEVHEGLPLDPLTDYSKYKALCEEVLAQEREPGFVCVTLRPATVCGWSTRLRLDLSVNILTTNAITNRRIKVFGGAQRRPNIHIADMVDLYLDCLVQPDAAIDGKIFNAGYENHRMMEIAELVRDRVGGDIAIDVVPTNDLRSYHISSQKIRQELGFVPRRSISDAVGDLHAAFARGDVIAPLTNAEYYNIKKMQEIGLG